MVLFTLSTRAVPDDEGTAPPQHDGTCELMSPFAIFVQLLLATIAFSTLIFKRSKERPMRPLKVWYVITTFFYFFLSGKGCGEV
jgi:hypothetical protein